MPVHTMRMPQTHVVSNPYARVKDYTAKNTHCETCDRSMSTKDWPNHERSKGHAQAKINNAKAEAEAADAALKERRTGDWAEQHSDSGAAGWDATPASGGEGGDWTADGEGITGDAPGGEWAAETTDAGGWGGGDAPAADWGNSGGDAGGFSSAGRGGRSGGYGGSGGGYGGGGGNGGDGCRKCGKCEWIT